MQRVQGRRLVCALAYLTILERPLFCGTEEVQGADRQIRLSNETDPQTFREAWAA